jgi:replication initiation protein RepC
VKNLNRALFKAGIFVMRDNEQGKRYGRRSPDSRIVEAYGFDLLPLAQRQEEFIRIAAAANVERQCMKELRRRKTLAIRAIRQAAQELEVQGCEGQALHRFADDTAELAATARHAERSRDLGPIVEGLERRRAEAEGQLRALIKPVKPDPEGLIHEPRRYTTTTREDDLERDTVVARQKGSPTGESTPKTPKSTSCADHEGWFGCCDRRRRG